MLQLANVDIFSKYIILFPVMQLFFPEHMISDSADVTKGITSSELVQVWWSTAFKNIKMALLLSS